MPNTHSGACMIYVIAFLFLNAHLVMIRIAVADSLRKEYSGFPVTDVC